MYLLQIRDLTCLTTVIQQPLYHYICNVTYLHTVTHMERERKTDRETERQRERHTVAHARGQREV